MASPDGGGAVSHRVPRIKCNSPGIIARARSRVAAAAPSVLAPGLGREQGRSCCGVGQPQSSECC